MESLVKKSLQFIRIHLFKYFIPMKKRTSDIIKLIKRNISEIDPNAQIILYGSRARGDEHTDSDWDLLILTDYPVDLNKESEFRYHLYDLGIFNI